MITISVEMGIGLVIALAGTITALFHALIKSKEDQIKLLQMQLEKVDQDKRSYHDGWVRALSASQTVAGVAARTIDIAERRNDS